VTEGRGSKEIRGLDGMLKGINLRGGEGCEECKEGLEGLSVKEQSQLKGNVLQKKEKSTQRKSERVNFLRRPFRPFSPLKLANNHQADNPDDLEISIPSPNGWHVYYRLSVYGRESKFHQ